MGKIVELVFPTLVITSLLTFILTILSISSNFLTLFRQLLYFLIPSSTIITKNISSSFETLNMSTSSIIFLDYI